MAHDHSALATAHVGLNVTDLKRSVVFYQQVFGFDILREDLGCLFGPAVRSGEGPAVAAFASRKWLAVS